VAAVNVVCVLRVAFAKLDAEDFVALVHWKKSKEAVDNSVSWGIANIESPFRLIYGDNVVLVCSFGPAVYFLALRKVEIFKEERTSIKYEWADSSPLIVS
jgi:hypothetical protein